MSLIPSSQKIGHTEITPWKDGRQGAFCLMFDDSVPSHVTNVVPEFKKRDLVGTFYVNPGMPAWKRQARAWERELPGLPCVVYGNHTQTHKGARSPEQLRDELAQCNEVIYRVDPGPKPRLISFGRPGVKPEDWTVTDPQVAAALKPLHLIERPPFGRNGAMIGPKTPEQMVALADAAITKKDLGYLIFHGVGGDWIVTPMDIFVKFLDLLEARRDRLWITDHISVHVYTTLREGTRVQAGAAESGGRQLRIGVTTQADGTLYDLPLTFVTHVPADWKACEVRQKGARSTRADVKSGVVQYAARPHLGDITLLRAG